MAGFYEPLVTNNEPLYYAHHKLGGTERFQSGLSATKAGCLLLRPHDFQPVWDCFRKIPLRKNPEGLFYLDLYDANEKMGVQHFKVSVHGRPSNRSYTGRAEPLRFNQYRLGLSGK